ncbi:AP-4 complex subunit epsilon-1 isoform X1 [Electrophorus electricus]|uniref:AP-4 complex subunit epsilon-1 isoform X1 n=1 Tax=Electrophorus electricus TaxID=8005 RepID=UPI0015D036C9|nr:AP-4 complex subunit epsilon-1 isoform X1 [Electrophorus electricus]
MSDVVEKTLTALPSLLSLDSQPGAGKLSSTSKLGQFIRNITELTSKHEEEKLIKKELAVIKDQVSSPYTTMRQMRELMVRSMYCEMLGYEASFAYIHAIKLAQQGTVLEKRAGYLAVSLFLNENHELLLLLVNTVLKDLQSTNIIEVCMALTVVSQIFPKDMIPAVLPLVEEKLSHPKEIIRRKAVLALYKFYLIAPNQVQHIHGKFRKALCDKDPGVMTSSLHIYLQMIQESPDSYKDLVGSFVTILRQVVGGKLPLDFNYHSIPAPWLQMQLLRILSLLGREDQSTSETMYDVLNESLRRAEMNHNITYAILYECVKAIYTIHPKAELLEKAAKCIGNFVLSPKINLKYLGLKALTYVVQHDASLALQHQMTIIECLDHSDLLIKRETLELLFRITNAQNVTVIVERILSFLRLCNDDYTIIDLVGKVAELAEKYAPDNEWFIQTMTVVFSLGGDLMPPDIPSSFLRLLAEGSQSEVDDRQLKVYAVNSYLSVLNDDCSHLPQRFLQVISWVLGEYSYLREGLDQEEVILLLKKLLDQRGVSAETRSWVLSALTKLCRGSGRAELALAVAESLSSTLDTVLRQQGHELRHLIQDGSLHARVLPQPAPANSLEVDSSLSFLDGFVSDALAAGAAPYKPPHQRQEELGQQRAPTLEPYALSLPMSLSSCTVTDRQSPSVLSMSSGLSANSTEPSQRAGVATLMLEGVKRVWGKEGYLPQRDTSETPATVEEPSDVVQSSHQQVVIDISQPEPEPEPPQLDKKQQLASSLFVGLGSQNSACLLGKTEATVPRFRRKPHLNDASSSGTSERSSDSSHSSHSTADSFLYGGLLEEEPATPIQSSRHAPQPIAASGSCEARQHGLTVNGVDENRGGAVVCAKEEKRAHPTQLIESDMVRVRPNALAEGAVVPPQNCSRHLPSTSSCGSDSEVLKLPFELQNLPHSDIISLISDSHLCISCCRVFREDALLIVLFLSNSTEMVLCDVALELSCEELQMGSLRGNVMESMAGRTSSVCHYTVFMERPHTHVPFTGTVSYQTQPGHKHTLHFSGKLTTADFIRPLVLSTEEYGKLWLSFSHDVKQNLRLLTDAGDPLIATLNVLKDCLQLHIVDIIGSEGIVACRLLDGAPCLMHCRVHGASLAVWLRSSLSSFPDCLLYHCQRALQEH